jgi:hypothetical protein
MTDRWRDLCEALRAFYTKVQRESFIAGEIATHIGAEFSKYIAAPDTGRVRFYRFTDPNDHRSYTEVQYGTNAVEQTPSNQWQFGLGVIVGYEGAPEFDFRWPLYITLSDPIIVENSISNKRLELVRRGVDYDYEAICADMYDAIVASFKMSAGAIPATRFGFTSNSWRYGRT